jgi:hypothetical protein
MSITAKWQLPYPELDNPADVPLWMQDLSERLDFLIVSFDSGNEADLPTSEKEGRFYYAIDTDRLWYDTGAGWIQVNATIGIVTREMLAPDLKPSATATPLDEAIRALGRGNDMAASGGDSRFPTDDQKAGLAGTSGLPSDINRYVTTLDSRLPTANQKAALAGTAGTPSDTNRYVTDQDGRLGSRVPVSTIPPNPTTWQEIILIADGPNHILWRLIWDGTAWAFLGGPPMSVFSSGGVSGIGNTIQSYQTAGPTLTVPFAGFYAVRVGGRYSAATRMDRLWPWIVRFTGIGIAIYETVFATLDRPSLLILATTLIVGPEFVKLDRRRSNGGHTK